MSINYITEAFQPGSKKIHKIKIFLSALREVCLIALQSRVPTCHSQEYPLTNSLLRCLT